MSGERNDGGAAFPVIPPMDESGIGSASGYPYPESGMSLRDWFAGQALAGLCANPGGPFQSNDLNGWDLRNCTKADVSREAYEMADAMITARAALSKAEGLSAGVEDGR